MGRQKDSRSIEKGDKTAESQREREKKRKLLAQNFQKVGILFIPKQPPGIPTGDTCIHIHTHSYSLFVCLFRTKAIHSCKHPQGGWIFACTAVFTPATRAVVLRLRKDLTCLLRICLYRREAIEGDKEG